MKKKSNLLLMGDGSTESLDLNSERAQPQSRQEGKSDNYENLFD